MIEKLICALRTAGVDADSRDVQDVLWLAHLLPSKAGGAPRPPPDPGEVLAPPDSLKDEPKRRLEPPPKRTREHRPTPAASRSSPRRALYSGSGEGLGAGTQTAIRVPVPAATALPGVLDLARALRPLSRRRPSRRFEILDEEATAERIADSDGVMTPVYRPTMERWFEVALLVEDSASMVIWRRTLTELHRLLEHRCAFSTVHRWSFGAVDQGVSLVGPAGHSPDELLHPSSQRLILVVSDCVSPAWDDGSMASLLADWGASTPVAIVQILSENLWSHTGLGTPSVGARAAARSPQRAAGHRAAVVGPGVPGGARRAAGRVARGGLGRPMGADADGLRRLGSGRAAAGGPAAGGALGATGTGEVRARRAYSPGAGRQLPRLRVRRRFRSRYLSLRRAVDLAGDAAGPRDHATRLRANQSRRVHPRRPHREGHAGGKGCPAGRGGLRLPRGGNGGRAWSPRDPPGLDSARRGEPGTGGRLPIRLRKDRPARRLRGADPRRGG